MFKTYNGKRKVKWSLCNLSITVIKRFPHNVSCASFCIPLRLVTVLQCLKRFSDSATSMSTTLKILLMTKNFFQPPWHSCTAWTVILNRIDFLTTRQKEKRGKQNWDMSFGNRKLKWKSFNVSNPSWRVNLIMNLFGNWFSNGNEAVKLFSTVFAFLSRLE